MSSPSQETHKLKTNIPSQENMRKIYHYDKEQNIFPRLHEYAIPKLPTKTSKQRKGHPRVSPFSWVRDAFYTQNHWVCTHILLYNP